jgi:hypothetical protein
MSSLSTLRTTSRPKRPETVPRPEPLWSVRVNDVTWSCELRFHESVGWEARILRDRELFAARAAFVTREGAAKSTEEQRKAVERGFLE